MKDEGTPWSQKLLEFWFGSLTDDTALNREVDPFRTHMQRWYGKDAAVDQEIRTLFEQTLRSLTGTAKDWRRAEQVAEGDVRQQLALTLLVDQLPRNMYRDTPQMYQHDELALAHAYKSLPSVLNSNVTLLERMFALVPLMHAENLTMQLLMEECFVQLLRDAEQRSPHNRDFYEFSVGYARRHREVIQRFGRFPHRNAILGRLNTPDEEKALREERIAF